jgi:FkbM family methyltransferase
MLALHHPVFSYFTPFAGSCPDSYQVDFLGTLIRHDFIAGLHAELPRSTGNAERYPQFDEEYFEWIDLLEAVASARESFTMIELGAGFGRWAVRAIFASQQLNAAIPCRVVAVEPEPVVYGWMHQHFRENRIDERGHSLVHAAISDVPGAAMFYIGGPRGGPYDRHPNAWYGQALTKEYDRAAIRRLDGIYGGFRVIEHNSGWRSIQIPSVTVESLLRNLSRVDLIDLDVEGQELTSLSHAIEQVDAKVKRLHIGTHSQEIESGLRQLLNAHGWECKADYSLLSANQTPWGLIHFENGVQSWVNPRLS